MAGPNKNWREIREQRPLNEQRVAMYGRIMDAEDRLEPVRRRRGLSETALGDALEVCESADDGYRHDDVYLGALTRYVAALGGHLEIRAVFPEETITLVREPAGAER
jgi:hypothetical protein